jgi:hypothetical protein
MDQTEVRRGWYYNARLSDRASRRSVLGPESRIGGAALCID